MAEGPLPTMIALTAGPIDVAAATASVGSPGAGAVVVFEGRVRDHNLGRAVAYLEYEAYDDMAAAEMARISATIARRWPGMKVAIVHRTGRVEVGETSVVVAASSAHRAEAFEACRFAIDSLKETVPIWKKEVWADGEEWVPGQGTQSADDES